MCRGPASDCNMYLWCALTWWSTITVSEGAILPWLVDRGDACLHTLSRALREPGEPHRVFGLL